MLAIGEKVTFGCTLMLVVIFAVPHAHYDARVHCNKPELTIASTGFC